MIVSEIMTTKLVTVRPDDTLSHAANLLRQYQIHHLPVVRNLNPSRFQKVQQDTHSSHLLLEGLVSSQAIDLVVALAEQSSSNDILGQPWQERRVAEIMYHASIRVTRNTDVAAAARVLVERNINCLPVVEYGSADQSAQGKEPIILVGEQAQTESLSTILVGLLTRTDLLLTLARSLGSFEPGMQLAIALPMGNLEPLAQTLLLATELHIQVSSIIAAPLDGNLPSMATIRLSTINPAPLLVRLQQANIQYAFVESDTHVS